MTKRRVRQSAYFAYHRAVRRDQLPQTYCRILQEDAERVGHLGLLERLHAILTHARVSVPYYRTCMADAGPIPKPDALAEYMASLPMLTKHEIRRHGGRLFSDDIGRRRTYRNTSGGSTGEPVLFVQDQAYWDVTTAVQMVHSESLGRRFGERELWIWGIERDFHDSAAAVRLRLGNRLANRELFNARRVSPAAMTGLLTGLDSNPPQQIVACAQAAYEIARFATGQGITISPQRGLVSTAETLYDFMRLEIEAVFGCPVYNRYGSREVGDIAAQCRERGGLHVFPWSVYVEIVDDEGLPVPAGTPGNVLVTSLVNFAMPLIRYAIGDRATLAPDRTCSCGRQGQMLSDVHGRATDMFRCEDGTVVDYDTLIELLYFRPWVRRFQIVQHEYSRFEFLLEVNDGLRPDALELDEIRAGVGQEMGYDCQVMFTFVDRLDTSASGKHRFTISHVH